MREREREKTVALCNERSLSLVTSDGQNSIVEATNKFAKRINYNNYKYYPSCIFKRLRFIFCFYFTEIRINCSQI